MALAKALAAARQSEASFNPKVDVPERPTHDFGSIWPKLARILIAEELARASLGDEWLPGAADKVPDETFDQRVKHYLDGFDDYAERVITKMERYVEPPPAPPEPRPYTPARWRMVYGPPNYCSGEYMTKGRYESDRDFLLRKKNFLGWQLALPRGDSPDGQFWITDSISSDPKDWRRPTQAEAELLEIAEQTRQTKVISDDAVAGYWPDPNADTAENPDVAPLPPVEANTDPWSINAAAEMAAAWNADQRLGSYPPTKENS